MAVGAGVESAAVYNASDGGCACGVVAAEVGGRAAGSSAYFEGSGGGVSVCGVKACLAHFFRRRSGDSFPFAVLAILASSSAILLGGRTKSM